MLIFAYASIFSIWKNKFLIPPTTGNAAVLHSVPKRLALLDTSSLKTGCACEMEVV